MYSSWICYKSAFAFIVWKQKENHNSYNKNITNSNNQTDDENTKYNNTDRGKKRVKNMKHHIQNQFEYSISMSWKFHRLQMYGDLSLLLNNLKSWFMTSRKVLVEKWSIFTCINTLPYHTFVYGLMSVLNALAANGNTMEIIPFYVYLCLKTQAN